MRCAVHRVSGLASPWLHGLRTCGVLGLVSLWPAVGWAQAVAPGQEEEDIIIIEEDPEESPPQGGPPQPGVPTLLNRLPGAPFDVPDLPPPLLDMPWWAGPGSPTSKPTHGRSFFGLRPQDITLTGQFGGRWSVRPLGRSQDDVVRNLIFATASVDLHDGRHDAVA